MKSSVKAALMLVLIAAVALIAYSLGRQQTAPPPSTTVPAAPSETAAPAPTKAAAPVTPAPTTANRAPLEKALALREAGKLAEAREALRELLTHAGDAQLVTDTQKALGDVNMQLLLTPAPAPEKVDYVVQPGDSLGRIAKMHNTTIEVIQKLNGLRETIIQPAQRLRVTPTKFALAVSKSQNTLLVTDDGKFFKLYRCGTGQYSTTPVGTFKITDRIASPPWWKDGQTIPFGSKENVLGKYWLALDIPHYGIHGTWEPETIGRQSSQGCIRLINEDVEELFIILPAGTPVQVTE
ncbi:MAG: L,D-transpeptidase family protein [Verrucomicrobia bacterium]|nr:L,D-transpeptidase family protein [Verrucomicrobiota bacterium]